MGALKAGVAVAAVLLIAARPPATAPAVAASPATVKAGVERWRANDYAAAVAIWQPFAAAGDPDALFNMGQAYKLGRGVAPDAVVARDYYRKAAIKGHLPAQANLGIALFQIGEKTESLKWLRSAADRGEPRAQYVLGIAAFNGDGLPRSQSLGYAYLLRAQASGLPQAATALGTIAPGLSPTDRTAGEAVAASLAAGTGVPAALAANRAPKFIPTPGAGISKPALLATPPRATSLPTRLASNDGGAAVATPGPTAAARGDGAATPFVPAASRPSTSAVPTSSPAQVRPASPAAIAPTTGSATTARPGTIVPAALAAIPRPSATAPSAIATTDVPPSKPVASTPATSGLAPPRGPVPIPAAVASAAPPAPASPSAVAAADIPVVPADVDTPKPVVPAKRAEPKAVAALKPFETIITDKPVAKNPAGWRVQLGAFSQRKLADAAWAVAKAEAGGAKPIFAAEGTVVKLQLGPYASREAAKSACAKLSGAGRACFITNG